MASIREKENSPYWFACFTLPDGTRTQRSTGIPRAGLESADYSTLEAALSKTLDAEVTIKSKGKAAKPLSLRDARRLAKRVADEFEDAARKGDRLSQRQARTAIADIYNLTHADRLPSSNVEEFLDRWLAGKAQDSDQRTHEKYASVAAQFKQSLRGKIKQEITSITSEDITRFRDELAARFAPGTVNVALKIIRSAFGKAFSDGLVDVNEAKRVSTLKRAEDRFERRAFTLAELKSILAVANNEWRGMILFGIYTGQRLGDVASLTWANLDLQQKELRLVTEKTDRQQILPLASPLVTYIESLPAGDDPAAPLFPRAHATVQRQGRAAQLSNEFYDVLVAAGLAKKKTHHAKKGKEKGRSAKREMNPLSFHCLRHTATSLLKRAGVSDAVAMEFVGHDSKTVSQQYTHIDGPTLKIAVEKLPDVTK